MGRFSLVLIGLSIGLAACAPQDPNVKPANRDNFKQARSEKSQVKGLDYVEYTVYRMAEIKQVVEAAVAAPAKLKKFESPACGQLVIDRMDETRRLQRFETVNCRLYDDEASGVNFKADGVDVVESKFAAEGHLERLWMRSVVPHQISGGIKQDKSKKFKRGGSSAALRERRELSLDLAAEADGVKEYRFSYSVDLNWSQEIKGENFQAFEDNSTSLMVLTGSLIIAGQAVEEIHLDLGRLETFAPRTIKQRDKYTRGRTPADQTFHKISLLLKAAKAEDAKERTPLRFDKAACGLPWGDLEVAGYKGGGGDDDRLSSQKEKQLSLGVMGIEVKATGQIRSWPDCQQELLKFEAKAGEIRNRIPYHEILFK